MGVFAWTALPQLNEFAWDASMTSQNEYATVLYNPHHNVLNFFKVLKLFVTDNLYIYAPGAGHRVVVASLV